MAANSVTIIFSPYHVGIRDHRVGNGPHRIRSHGVVQEFEGMGINVSVDEIPPVHEYEGEIGRSFELLRRISKTTSKARDKNSFPLILSGNCMASAAVACGLGIEELGFVYFDAHDDLDWPDVNENGYFDAMSLSMLRGESWKKLMSSVPGFHPFKYDRFIYCGLRDQSDIQRQRVMDAGMTSIWDDISRMVDFAAELDMELSKKSFCPALIHLDLDVLDSSYGKVNDYPSPGGMFEPDLIPCMELVPRKVKPTSLTVCSFDLDAGDGDKIAKIGIRAIMAFMKSLINAEQLVPSQ